MIISKQPMESIRQNKVSELIKRELSFYFQQNTRTVCKGAMVSVTIMRVSKDLSVAKAYVSIFGVGGDKNEVIDNIRANERTIRMELTKVMRNQLRKFPTLQFFMDDSIDYAETIDNLLS